MVAEGRRRILDDESNLTTGEERVFVRIICLASVGVIVGWLSEHGFLVSIEARE